MKWFSSLILLLVLLFLTSACLLEQTKLAWRVKDVALAQTPAVELQGANEQIVITIPTRRIQQMVLAHLRIGRSANVQSELFLVEGEEPNAFAGLVNGQRVIGINLGMVKLIGDDANEYAALISHEAAHWAKGHVESGQMRSTTLKAMGILVGAGLGMAGVPAAGFITGLGVELIDSSYSRDQEREADAQSIDFMLANNYDPYAAIKLQENMLKAGSALPAPFLSSHPSGAERIANLKALIERQISQNRAIPAPASKTVLPSEP